ncbi:Hypothetical protein CINCED_3A024382 [Cinara cedri]|uniref:Uncharacterized protein n=1 Tax=Cinara cedri TaxID=506608 RepID=A0A5E4NN78_9HEMI|nr:Hypothetical protein CINCED_3A024382 [Cinara cedri]
MLIRKILEYDHIDEINIRPLLKPIYRKKFLGEVQASTTEYLDVFEERSSALIIKLPSKIELRKTSIEKRILYEYRALTSTKTSIKMKYDLSSMMKLFTLRQMT